MKILSVEQIRQADAYTIEHEPIKSVDLMERAATNCFCWISERFDYQKKIFVFCGLGNNGGDGLVIARLLSEKNYQVNVYVLRYTDKSTDDFKINYDHLLKLPQVKVLDIIEGDQLPQLSKDDLIIDALIGSGLTKPVKGFLSEVINHINLSGSIVISIDIPSGLLGDKTSAGYYSIIKANYTLTFQFPKYSFLFPENYKYVGEWCIISIGLHPEFINKEIVKNYLITQNYIKNFYKIRGKFAHKGNFGHALLIAGSYGKMGAALLSAKACLRSGIGLLTVHVPKCGYEIIQTEIPEAMVSIDLDNTSFTTDIQHTNYNVIAVGPGIGQDIKTQNALAYLILHTPKPIIFDADAINILGLNTSWITEIPKNSILTPHVKEFERLAGKAENDFHRNELQRDFAIKHQVYVVLKGAHTSIACPDGDCYFNTTGNPGMATAGSGDVLTGIILGLLSQGYTSKEACIMGVYIHGLAGDIAADISSYESLIASDIIKNLGNVFKKLSDKK